MNTAAVAVAAVALLVGALLSIDVGLRPARPSQRSTRPSRLDGVTSERVAAAAAVGVVVLLATRFVALALLAAAAVITWRRLLHDERADDERRRLEAIASWLEDLRDALRGSSMGVEEALEHVALRPPAAIAAPLARFVHRRRQGHRIDEALDRLALDLDHPTATAAVASLRLVVSGSTGAGRLHPTVSALAAAARDEVRARERIDRTRAVYQASMKRLVVIATALLLYLRFAAGDLLAPYATAAGQLFLVVPLAMWVGCVFWLRSLCGYEQTAVPA